MTNYNLEVARGRIANVTSRHNFGRAPAGVDTAITDIWAYAATQNVFLAPTAARIHAIVSTSASDSSAGVGARTVRVYGLNTWSSVQTSEDVILNGTTPVNTVSSYVHINTMKILTSGGTSINAGVIKATAATDATISCVIDTGKGQSAQAILAVPDKQKFYLTDFSGSMYDPAGTKNIKLALMVNENPNVQTTNYITKRELLIGETGSSFAQELYPVPQVITGPCLIKVQGVASTNDTDATASFDGYLVNN